MSNTELNQAFDQFAKAAAELCKAVLIVCGNAFQQLATHLARLNTLFKATTPPRLTRRAVRNNRRQWKRKAWNRYEYQTF